MSPLLNGITWLLLFQCAGEAISRLLTLPVPGPVAGMLLLFVVLRVRDRVPSSIGTAGDGLARHLSLLFVPAGVGVMMHFGRLAGEWLPVAVALLVSTVAAIAASALTFAALLRRQSAVTDDHLPGRGT
jgi:holin-like protein